MDFGKLLVSAVVCEENETTNNDESCAEVMVEDVGENVQIVVADDILQHLSTVCRCCLSERNDLQAIFDDGGRIAEMIMAFAAVQVEIEDLLPAQICTQCVAQVSRTLSFKQQIETVDATLRHYISNGSLSDLRLGSIDGVEVEQIEDVSNNEKFEIYKISEETYCETKAVEQKIAVTADAQQISGENYLGDGEKVNESFVESVQFFDNTNEYQLSDNKLINVSKSDTHITISQLSADNNTSQQNEDELLEILELKNVEEHEDLKSIRSTSSSPFTNSPLRHHEENDEDLPEQPVRASKRKVRKSSDENIEKKNLRWACFVCKKKFPDIRRLNRHKKIHTNNKPFYCGTCHKGFNERTDLNRHVARHTRLQEDEIEYAYNCTECHMGFTVARDLKIHSSIHSKDGRLICTECDKEFSSSTQIKRHVRTHFEDKPHKCRVCLKGFSEMGSLTRHFRRHTGEQRERKHVCKFCGKKYYDTYSLNVHNRTHTGERPWICTICGRGFIDSRLLNSHLKIHSNEKPFACTICDKRFTHQSTLTTHSRTHTGEKPYVCSVCGKTFIQSSNLSLHMRVHSGERPYQCSVCSRSFASSSTLTMHMRVHTGEKPYNCQICSRSFARHDLSAHMRTHTGEKPFVCSQCSKRFTTSGQLNQHARTHTGEKPFVCDICNKACSSSSYLKKHKKTHSQTNSGSGKNTSKDGKHVIETECSGIESDEIVNVNGEKQFCKSEKIIESDSDEDTKQSYNEQETIESFNEEELVQTDDEFINHTSHENAQKHFISNDVRMITIDNEHELIQGDSNQPIIEILPGLSNEELVSVSETQFVRFVDGQPTEIINKNSS